MNKILTVTTISSVGLVLLIATGCGQQVPLQDVTQINETPAPPPETAQVPTPSMVKLQPSGSTGLLKVPLPEGAVLVKSVPGNRAEGRDPQETYEIDATNAQLRSFFLREMKAQGWVHREFVDRQRRANVMIS